MSKSGKSKIPNIFLSDDEKDDGKELKVLRKDSKCSLKWTDAEVEALKSGVSEFGTGNWRRILAKYSTIFGDRRRVVDLVSKHRLLQKESSFYRTPKRDWVEIDDNGEPKLDALGEIIVVTEKFPFDAAKKFAKKKVQSGQREFIISIRETQNIENKHSYIVELNGTKIVMKKLTPKTKKE